MEPCGCDITLFHVSTLIHYGSNHQITDLSLASQGLPWVVGTAGTDAHSKAMKVALTPSLPSLPSPLSPSPLPPPLSLSTQVLVISHIPPGSVGNHAAYGEFYLNMTRQFSEIIVGHLFGHTHMDEIELVGHNCCLQTKGPFTSFHTLTHTHMHITHHTLTTHTRTHTRTHTYTHTHTHTHTQFSHAHRSEMQMVCMALCLLLPQ